KHVALAYDKDGKCVLVSLVKLVNEREYNRLLNEQNEHTSELDRNDKFIKDKIAVCENDLRKLHSRDLFVSKATYDKFVDRGYLNEDKEFDKAFFDFVFNGCELDLEKAPLDFKTILEKVVEEK
ncbi:MAG: hypothetical protein J6S67_25065, partial [Methanobrevibacter sp.]|nr:hypothetical protein [Methanobrevibacter sp.]